MKVHLHHLGCFTQGFTRAPLAASVTGWLPEAGCSLQSILSPCLYPERQFRIKSSSFSPGSSMIAQPDCKERSPLGDVSQQSCCHNPAAAPEHCALQCCWCLFDSQGEGKFADWNTLVVKESKALCPDCCKTNHEESQAEKLLSCYFCIRDFTTLLKKFLSDGRHQLLLKDISATDFICFWDYLWFAYLENKMQDPACQWNHELSPWGETSSSSPRHLPVQLQLLQHTQRKLPTFPSLPIRSDKPPQSH